MCVHRRIARGLAWAVVGFCLCAQDTTPPLRVFVNLVQVDAVVTDRRGHPVRDLTNDDFELFEDGQPRKITHFSFVHVGNGTAAAPALASPRPRSAPPASVAREDVHRTIALVVDDLQMSFASIHHAREAIKKFIDEQIGPGDLVAIVPTSGGMGALQQFTTDRRLLGAAAGRIRFALNGANAAGAVGALGHDVSDDVADGMAAVMKRRFAVGTLSTLRSVTAGMRDMPGRKSLVLFSDGFAMFPKPRREPPVDVTEVRRVANNANQSAVVIYGVDARGLVYPGLQAQDDTSYPDTEQVMELLHDRTVKIHDSREGLEFLAYETGGLSRFDDNDLNGALNRMLEDQAGYYLLGFSANDEDAARIEKEGKYHRLQVRVKRPGLVVRYRKGYLGSAASPQIDARTPQQRLLAALASPFAGTGVHLRFTPTFALDEHGQTVVRALLHIAGGDLAFGPPGPEGWRTATLHIVALTEGEDAKAGANTERAYNVRLKDASLAKLEANGLVYAFEHPLKKPGPYQMRVAVLDVGSGRVGSASQFIEVPDLRAGMAVLSGITMSEGDWCSGPRSEMEAQERDTSSAVRVFRRGHPFSFGATVYNALIDADSGQPVLDLQACLLRGEDRVWEGHRFPLALPKDVDPKRIPGGTVLTLGEKTAPGEYVIELRAVDRASGRVVASQSIDFELQ
jgi:VWFA-related protein